MKKFKSRRHEFVRWRQKEDITRNKKVPTHTIAHQHQRSTSCLLSQEDTIQNAIIEQQNYINKPNMMEPSIFRPNHENQESPSSSKSSRKKKTRNKHSNLDNDGVRRRSNRNEDYERDQSGSYIGSFCRKCCTFQHFCYLVQLINCCLLCGLIYLILREYPKLQALDEMDDLQKQLQKDECIPDFHQ